SSGLDRNYEGAGLGLSISKRVIEMFGGKIIVQSEQGMGTTFRIELLPASAPEMMETLNQT
ncbi:MAG: ATP-binding protein, partial [Bacteroidota bacterium]